ncbi:hypothetical protein [Noviherbaspirillum sp.]|uniref:hypothetical protein n=1 Tax=Noviherbaspirillum sp. TaxID=1926288 RepID=UPI0025DB14E4|nr:hypothetical protein [Noviherbaspirillum sp.]
MPLVPEVPDVSVLVLGVVLVLGAELVPEAPLLLMPEEPDVPLSLLDGGVFVVVVVTVLGVSAAPEPDVPDMPEVPEVPDVPAVAPDVSGARLLGSTVVVVVVVLWATACVAMPISDRNITMGNFFILAPSIGMSDV